MFNSLLATPAFDVAEPVILWLTVALVCAAVLAGVLIFFLKRDIFNPYVKYSVLGATFYALCVGILMVVLNLVKRTDPAYMEENYLNADVINYVLVPLLVAFAVALVCSIALFAISKKGTRKVFKICAIIFGILIVAGIISAAVTISIYYSNHIENGGYYDGGYGEVNQLVLYISAAVFIVAEIAAAILLGLKDKSGFDSRCIALAGITVALSFALSYVKLFELPQGGSVTFASLLPIMLFAYAYGTKKGVLVCFLYGLLQAIQDPYIIHPAQFLLDYPIAFSMVGFAGVFANVKALDKVPQVKFVLGAALAGLLRYASHVLSGVFAFSAYAIDEGMGAWVYSLAYNSFVFVDLVLVVVAGALLFSSKAFNKQLKSFTAISKTKQPAPEQTDN